jgi:NADPH:quinone reductase-like Zn-dependent oxidoreductase
VLIPAASSSVGIASVQIAKLVGATPIALTRKDDKREALTRLGAAHVIAVRNEVAPRCTVVTHGYARAIPTGKKAQHHKP